jgi:hypothetical protein
MSKFPGPTYNRIIEQDPQIVSVGTKKDMDWGARPSGMPKDTQNSMTIRHVGSDKK